MSDLIQDPFKRKKRYMNEEPSEPIESPVKKSKSKFLTGFGNTKGIRDVRPKKVRFKFM